MSPDILVCSNFVASFIFVGDYKMSKKVKSSIFEKMILVPFNWNNAP